MAGIKCSGSVLIVMLLVVSVVKKASAAAAPNSLARCMQDCAVTHCTGASYAPGSEWCNEFCANLCTYPNADVVDRFCKLGCVSSKCSTLSSNSAGAEAVEGCIRGCSNICTEARRSPVVV